MPNSWNDNEPIYRQLKGRVVEMILSGIPPAGEQLPSVRQIAADFQLNPLTVSRAYQELADEGYIEKRRGMGMYVAEGALERLYASERERFMQNEWPQTLARMKQLGIDPAELLAQTKGRKAR
jgi:GntR family transcriptional regulator